MKYKITKDTPVFIPSHKNDGTLEPSISTMQKGIVIEGTEVIKNVFAQNGSYHKNIPMISFMNQPDHFILAADAVKVYESSKGNHNTFSAEGDKPVPYSFYDHTIAALKNKNVQIVIALGLGFCIGALWGSKKIKL